MLAMLNLRRPLIGVGVVWLTVAGVGLGPAQAETTFSINGQAIQDNGPFDTNQQVDLIQLANFSPPNSPTVTISAEVRLEVDADSVIGELVLTEAYLSNFGDALAPIDFDFRGEFSGRLVEPNVPGAWRLRQHLELLLADCDPGTPCQSERMNWEWEGTEIPCPCVLELNYEAFLNEEPWGQQFGDIAYLFPEFPGRMLVAPPDIVDIRDDLGLANLGGRLRFVLEPQTAAFLPDSASITVSYIPEPGCTTLAFIALTTASGSSFRRCRSWRLKTAAIGRLLVAAGGRRCG